jgi:hypothetical protein
MSSIKVLRAIFAVMLLFSCCLSPFTLVDVTFINSPSLIEAAPAIAAVATILGGLIGSIGLVITSILAFRQDRRAEEELQLKKEQLETYDDNDT